MKLTQIQEVYNAIENINFELSDQYEELEVNHIEGTSYNIFLELSTNAFSMVISYLNFVIWKEDEDEREFYEDQNEYEPLEEFLRKKCKKFMQLLHNFQIQKEI